MSTSSRVSNPGPRVRPCARSPTRTPPRRASTRYRSGSGGCSGTGARPWSAWTSGRCRRGMTSSWRNWLVVARRVMAVVLGNLHATAQGPTDDEANGDVQFMHTFVLERGRRGGDTAGAGDEISATRATDGRDCRRGVPAGGSGGRRARAGRAGRGGGVAAPRGESPPPTRGGLGRRDGDDQTGTSDGETSSSFGEKSPKMAKNGQTTADAPEDGGDSPESTKTRKTPNADDLDDSVDEADVWLTNPMYGDVPESNPGHRASQTDDAPNETPRAVRRAPGSAEVVPESPAINFASPNPFEDEAEGAGGGGAREGVRAAGGVPERGADGAARVPDDSRRPMSPDANSIPLPSRSLLGANGANGRPGSGESRLNRVSRRYSHELEDAGTRRTLFDESPYVNRGRGESTGLRRRSRRRFRRRRGIRRRRGREPGRRRPRRR